MLKSLGVLWMVLAAGIAMAQDSPIGNETPSAEQATDKAAARTTDTADARKDHEFKPPPGFLTKKRGDLVLYCKKDRTTGTRFATEKCYDEDQMREYLLALEIQMRDVERIRSTCTTAAVCRVE
jgi:hypothetical protein